VLAALGIQCGWHLPGSELVGAIGNCWLDKASARRWGLHDGPVVGGDAAPHQPGPDRLEARATADAQDLFRCSRELVRGCGQRTEIAIAAWVFAGNGCDSPSRRE